MIVEIDIFEDLPTDASRPPHEDDEGLHVYGYQDVSLVHREGTQEFIPWDEAKAGSNPVFLGPWSQGGTIQEDTRSLRQGGVGPRGLASSSGAEAGLDVVRSSARASPPSSQQPGASGPPRVTWRRACASPGEVHRDGDARISACQSALLAPSTVWHRVGPRCQP
jgi:hypothetical protein